MSDLERASAPSVQDTAEYLADLIGQLKRLASKVGFDVVAHALEVAELAAIEEAAGRCDPGSPDPARQMYS